MALTEQWEKGELEWDREYYVDLENNGIVKQLYLDEDGCFFDGIIDYSLKNKPYIEVLAPVPSYEEWKAAYECQLMESELVLTLKELLKECGEKFVEAENNYGFDDSIVDICDPIIKKIDEVLK